MKVLFSVVSMLILACSAVAASAAVMHGDIRMEIVFLDGQYSEVGRWIFYCDDHFEQVGQTDIKHYEIEYSCPE